MTTTVATLQAVFKADPSNFLSGMRMADNALTRTGKNITGMGKTMTKYLTLPMLAAGGVAVGMAAKWETGFTGVAKTVDGTNEQLSALEQQLLDLATSADSPVSSLSGVHQQITDVAAAAGQLGVGIDDVAAFTENMLELGMATDLTAENAAIMTARFANVTGMDFSQLDGFSSALVNLGNNMAATEGEILTISQRLGGTLTLAGFTFDEILGMGAALAALGIPAEAGATAVNKAVQTIEKAVATGGEDLDKFATVAGMSADEFAKYWEEDAAGAFGEFIRGLGEMPAADQFQTLEDLGFGDTRMVDTMLKLAGGVDIYDDAMRIAAEGAADGGKHIQEAGKFAETTEGQFNALRNKTEGLGIKLGTQLLPVLNDVMDQFSIGLDYLNDMNPALLQLGAYAIIAGIAIGPLTTIVGGLVTAVGMLGGALLAISLPVWGVILLVGALGYAWATNFGGMRDWVDDLRYHLSTADLGGVLLSISDAFLALPKTLVKVIAGSDAWERGIEGWKTTFQAIEDIINWIGDEAGNTLSSIDFEIPGVVKELYKYFKGISDAAGVVGSILGIEPKTTTGTLITTTGGEGEPVSGTRAYYDDQGNLVTTQSHDFMGSYSMGQPYVINPSAGPELWVPGESGTAYPAGTWGGGGSGGIIIQGPIYVQGVQNVDDLYDELEQVAGRRGMELGVKP